MKHLKKYTLFLIAVFLVLSFNVVSFAFGFYDSLSYHSNLGGIQVGNWNVSYTQYAPSFDFETFTNTATNTTINVTLNSVPWSMYNMVRASATNDDKIGTRSIKCSKTGYLRTVNYYTYFETISFYASSTKTGSNGVYVVEIASNGTNWTQIASGSTTTNLVLQTVNMDSILQNGFTLSDGTTALSATPLMFRIYFNKSNAGGNITFYCDNVSFVYNVFLIS